MLCRFQTIFQYRTLRQKLTPKSLLWCFWQGVTLDATPTHMHTYQHTNFPWCISKNVWEILLLCLDRLGGWKYLILRLSNCLSLTLLLMPHTQRRRQRGDVPCRKNCPPWATVLEGLLPVLRKHTLLERSYSTRTTMKRTNFARRFDKLDFNLQKVNTHSQSSGHIQKS